jgi:hypothetical protein
MFGRINRWIKGKIESFAFSYMPRIADGVLWCIAKLAERRLGGSPKEIKVLVDSPIHAHAVTHEEIWINTGTVHWGGVHPIDTGHIARVPVYSDGNKSPDYEDICHLGALIGLVRFGPMSFLTSSELIAEQERQPPARFNPIGYSDYSVLQMIRMESVDGLKFDYLTIGKLIGDAEPALAQWQRERINRSGDPIHQAIMAQFVHEKHSQDAWHLRTAQVYGCQYLLTMDRALVRLYQQHQRKLIAAGITAEICTPTMLARRFKLPPVPPKLFSYNDASFWVRTDLTMPGEKRRRSKGKRGVTIDDITPQRH